MDELKLKQAIAMLNSIHDNLPEASIEEKYVDLLHRTFTDIETVAGLNLDYYAIPDSELKRHITSLPSRRVGRFGGGETTYSDVRYCDRERFLISLKGAIGFINSLSTESGRRPPGFI